MATHHPIRKHVVPQTPEIPDKLYFRIGDVARLCQVPAYVLRFWETEFPQLKPNKGGTGQRLYRKRDVEMALRIKSLLYDQGYTIPGARQVFKSESQAKAGEPVAFAPAAEPVVTPEPVTEIRREAVADAEQSRKLNALRAELRSLLSDLSRPASVGAMSVAAESKLKTMRPRLVVEPRPERPARPEAPRLLQLHQRDLFGFEDDDPGPVAS